MQLLPLGYRDRVTLFGGEGVQWVDGETVGRLLYPSHKDPDRAARKVYDRNKRHFSDRDTILSKVNIEHDLRGQFDPAATHYLPPHNEAAAPSDLHRQSDGAATLKKVTQKREMRFFSLPHGVAKICNFSRSPHSPKVIDKLFDLHAAFINGTLPKPEPSLLRLAHMPLHSREVIEERKRLAIAENRTYNTILRREAKVRAGESVNKPRPKGANAVHLKHRALFNDAIKLRRQGLTGIEIARKLDVPDKTLYRWFKNGR